MSGDKSHSKSGISGITKEIRRYIEARLELFVLTLSEQFSLLIADSVRLFAGILFLAGGLFFAWFAMGFYLSSLFENYAIGFLVSSLPLIIAGIVFINMKSGPLMRNVQAKVMGRVMESLNQYTETDEENERENNSKRETEE